MNKKVILISSLIVNVVLISLLFIIAVVYKDSIKKIIFSPPKQPKIIMFGNSITEGGNWAKLLGRSDVRNSGNGRYTTTQFVHNIQRSVIKFEPEICFLMGGINDIVYGVSIDRIIENYKSILDTLNKNKITTVVQSTLYQHHRPKNNQVVGSLNNFLIGYCKTNNVHYLDINSKLSDSSGLKRQYTSDGTHLSEAAYILWAKEVQTLLKLIENTEESNQVP